MDNIQALINLQADLEKIAVVIQTEGWRIAPSPLTSVEFYATLTSRVDSQSYMFRIEASGYPDEPPSIRCVNPETKDPMDAKAWPNCEGFRPPPTADLCLNMTREGLKQLHPDWQNDPQRAWDSSGNPIWRVLQALQDRLDDRAKYHGRVQ